MDRSVSVSANRPFSREETPYMRVNATHALVIQRPGGCLSFGSCDESTRENRVTVESIEQHEAIGWKLRGTGRVEAHCTSCGAMYQAVQKTIPIECGSYPCPTCGEMQNLTYKVQRIDTNGREFSFEAEISCSRCHKKKTFVEVLKDLFKLKKLEVKLSGISVER
jgi:5-methylcytosine-specific restriction endonuclease McrA